MLLYLKNGLGEKHVKFEFKFSNNDKNVNLVKKLRRLNVAIIRRKQAKRAREFNPRFNFDQERPFRRQKK